MRRVKGLGFKVCGKGSRRVKRVSERKEKQSKKGSKEEKEVRRGERERKRVRVKEKERKVK